MLSRYLAAGLILLFSYSVSAQDIHIIDSLSDRLKGEIHDTDRVYTLNELAWEMMYTKVDTAIILSTRALKIAESLESKVEIANSWSLLGTFNWLKGEYARSLEYHFNSLKINEGIKRIQGIKSNYLNIGIVYDEQGDYPMALEYYLKSLKLDEELGDKRAMAADLVNIGSLYGQQDEYSKAMEYLFQSLRMNRELKRETGIAICLANIAHVFVYQADSCLEAGDTALAHSEFYPKALDYYYKALDANEHLGNKTGSSITLGNIGSLYIDLGEFKKAEPMLKKALAISLEIGAKERLKNQYEFLSILYDTTGRPAQAFEAYKLFISYRDSIDNEENTKAQTRAEMKYEYEKAELVAEQDQNEKQRISNEKLKRRDNLQYSIVLICLLVIGLIVAMLGRLALPDKVAEGLIFFAFLILFEFILVLADPYVDVWTGGAPGWKLLINATIAGLIFPLHSFFELKLKARLVK